MKVQGSNAKTTRSKKKLEKTDNKSKEDKDAKVKKTKDKEGKATKVQKTAKISKEQELPSKLSMQKLTSAAIQSSPSSIENGKQDKEPKTTAKPSKKYSKQVPKLDKKKKKCQENNKQIPIVLVKKGP